MGLVKFLKFKLTRRLPAQTDGGDEPNSSDGETVKRLSWAEVERSTRAFSLVIGYGGFSTVYLAEFLQGTFPASRVAVKLFHACTHRLRHAFRQELHVLQNIGRHDNIVRLLGYCNNPADDSALIFEYVPNGTLHERLHGSALLRWPARLSVAFQLAQALAYLHDACQPHVVHGDIKPSNVLLDDAALNCKLCDFGSARMGFSSSVLHSNSSRSTMVGSPGYTDPLYLKTGLASRQNDVYSFGVVLLELITGLEAVRTKSLMDVEAVVAMVDPRIREEADLDEVRAMAALSWRCLSESPGVRPSVADVLDVMSSSIFFLFQKKDSP